MCPSCPTVLHRSSSRESSGLSAVLLTGMWIFATATLAHTAPLKVFVLAGQSNMEGHAKVDTFDYIGDDPATVPLLREMRGPDGKHKCATQPQPIQAIAQRAQTIYETDNQTPRNSQFAQGLPFVHALGRGRGLGQRARHQRSIDRSPKRRYRIVTHDVIHAGNKNPRRESLRTCGTGAGPLP